MTDVEPQIEDQPAGASEVAGHLAEDPEWFRRAVFYELLVRGFHDSNDDGTGDLRGVIDRLDYLEWLGVDCIWLLPFYASPLHDGGYDVADYTSVHPDYGTVDDAAELIADSHGRGMRVIADLVINHTSDQHPWFQDSRRRRNGRDDWYVWTDDPTTYAGVPNIFPDTETGCWTFDDVRGQYYWHRFFHHQPDLNYEHPAVHDAILDVVRFWLDMGFDGFRLDAVPYLYEREGTSCEGLPETHVFLKRLRRIVDDEYPGRVLLAEANGLPSEVVDYYGDGDECHMCFHFPLMPRMFMAVKREQRYPITETLNETPALPAGCQWGLFLRNHDELALAQVTDEERDYLVREFAKDPRAKLHLGIRRRLFPLIDNDRRIAELFHALLFSLPGSPVLYYGDEIGMGDNIFLGDRDTVRTPMQWSPDRNGGFSKADFQQIYLPPLMDPLYGFQAVNVEASQRDQSSYLHWMKAMLAARKRHPVFGVGGFELLPAANPSILAFLRHSDPAGDGVASVTDRDLVLCVYNLSRFAQPVELTLGRFAGLSPIEVLGRAPFPKITQAPYQLTVAPHGFFWFRLTQVEYDPPMTADEQLDVVDEEVLAAAIARYLPQQRWFTGDRHALARVELRDLEVLNDQWPLLVWAIVTAELRSGGRTDYQVIAGLRRPGDLEFLEHVPVALMGEVPTHLGPAVAYNALHDPELAMMLLQRLAPDEHAHHVRQIGAEVATSILVFDERLLLRIFRILPDGPNPDVETVRALAGVGFRHVAAPLAGWRRGDVDLAVLREFVAGGAEGWQLALTSLRDLYDRRTEPDQAPGDFGPEARRLGVVTAELHESLAQAFPCEPARPSRWADRLLTRLDEVRHLEVDHDAIAALAERVRDLDDVGQAIRVHGDYQLRRVMRTDAGWYVLGFEGERHRAPEVASRITSPLEDLGRMLRSIHDATRMALHERADDAHEDRDELEHHADAWEAWIGRSFLDGYLSVEPASALLPVDDTTRAVVQTTFELVHALRSLRQAADSLPSRVGDRHRSVDVLLSRLDGV